MTYCDEGSTVDMCEFTKPPSREVRPITGYGGELVSLHAAIARPRDALAGEIEGTRSLESIKNVSFLECVSA